MASTTLAPPAALTIFEVASLHATWLAAPEGDDLLLDLAQVAEADTAGLQLLLFWQTKSQAGGSAFICQQPSAAVSETAALLGLQARLAWRTEESGGEHGSL